MRKISILGLMVLMGLMGQVKAQHDSIPETDPLIVNRIGEWQDLKFGFMMHWGIYAQWGIVESWNICNEPWINRNGADYYQYKTDYQNLNKTFNPKNFDPFKIFYATSWPRAVISSSTWVPMPTATCPTPPQHENIIIEM